jgi:hypothetical protein
MILEEVASDQGNRIKAIIVPFHWKHRIATFTGKGQTCEAVGKSLTFKLVVITELDIFNPCSFHHRSSSSY